VSGRDTILFDEFCLVPAARTLTRNGSPVGLRARALDILIALIERAGHAVSQAELFAMVWEKRVVEESNLRVNIAILRKALGDDQLPRRFIVSVPGGYTFIAKVERRAGGQSTSPSPEAPIGEPLEATSAAFVTPIGREETIDEIATELRRKRFITITGTGGVGKTTVALAVSRQIATSFRDGLRLFDLGPLANPALVVPYIASLLRVPAADRHSLPYVTASLRGRNMLMLFDNCEHIIDVVSEIAEAIFQGARDVHILATSREPLRATGEWVWRLDPLPVPPFSTQLTAEQALRFPAVQLLAERTLGGDISYPIVDDDAPIMADICRRLDGLPLAIELAATRVPLLGFRGLADRLSDRLVVLGKGRRTASQRHQSLGAVIDWSYATLSAKEKAVWPRLAVFPGTFTLEAAAAVATSTESKDIVSILDDLVQKSLVSVDLTGDEIRYRLLESLRLYALTKLREGDDADKARARHAQYWYKRSVGCYNDRVEMPTREWQRMHGAEIADIRAALEWSFGPTGDPSLGIKLTAASALLWFKVLLQPELRRYLEHAIRLTVQVPEVDDGVIMKLHLALGRSIVHAGGSERELREALDQAFVIADRRNDILGQLQAIWTRWGQAINPLDFSTLTHELERAQAIVAKCRELPVVSLYYARMAALSYHLWGDQEIALGHAQQALEQAESVRRDRLGNTFIFEQELVASSHYSRILWLCGYPDKSLAVFRAAIENAADRSFELGFFVSFTGVFFWSGDFAAADRHLSSLVDVGVDVESERPTASTTGQHISRFITAAVVYRRVIDCLIKGDLASRDARDKIRHDPALSPFDADNLSTFHWRLLCPQSLQRAMAGKPNWCTAEVLRAAGEDLLDSGKAGAPAEAERLFLRSIDISRRQRALSWELRSAISVARLWHAGGQTVRATDLLASVYGRFTEGFATRDLTEAKTLLDTWRSLHRS
jgi:predicted ATPase/DNA-binding winged helix-turn-helix (wHTH) protein